METERLRIREYTEEDFDALYEILSDAETMKYYPRPYDENGVRRWINWCLESYGQNGFGLWALELKEPGAFIGDCGISMQRIDGELLPEIGYHVHKNYWRQGYAKEACRAVKDWLFENTDYPCVYSYMNRENIASRATAAANGMTQIKEYVGDGEALAVYAITREQWQEKNGNKIARSF
jgi:RimJ/RimL family protein N-acetyltransferase